MSKKMPKNAGIMRSLGRAAATSKNFVWLALKSLLLVGLLSFVLTVCAAALYVSYACPGSISWVWAWIQAETKCPVQVLMSVMPIANRQPEWLRLTDPDGNDWEACDFAEAAGPQIKEWVKYHAWKLELIFGGCTIVAIGFCARRGRQQLHDEYARGAKLIDANAFHPNYRGSISLAGVPLPPDAENQHTLILGAPGSGKTTLIYELADQIRARKQRAICYDVTGEFAEYFYRPGDYILNPLHSQSVFWHPWCEYHYLWDGVKIAKSLIPDDKSNDQFWTEAARTLLAVCLDRITDNSVVTLLEWLCTPKLTELAKRVEGTGAAALVSENSPKTALSVQATIAAHTQSLRFLWSDSGGQEAFSISDWVSWDSGDNSWLFLSVPAAQLAALRPLITVWLEVAADAALSLKPSRDRRLWILIDELATLGKLSSIPNLLAQGRKYGACGVLGLQSYAQLKDIYGNAGADAIGGQCSTWATLRVPDPDSAAWASKSLGECEVLETTEGLNYGSDTEGIRLSQTRHNRQVVMASEIQSLPDLEGYLRIPGPYPIVKFVVKPKRRQPIGPGFEMVDVKRTVYSQSTREQQS